MNLVGSRNAGSAGSTSTIVSRVAERHLERQQVAELLLEHVADHALGLRPQHVQRVRLDGVVGGPLERQQPHLRPVAVRQHEAVLARDRGERPGGDADVLPLGVCGHRLPALQQGVAPERDHGEHGSLLLSALGSRL